MTITTDAFTYSPKTKTFTAEASELAGFGLKSGRPIRLVSARTGDAAQFVYAGNRIDREGEITAWIFKPSHEDIQRCPGLAGSTIQIIND